jgi:PAS domain S-box-containing protein
MSKRGVKKTRAFRSLSATLAFAFSALVIVVLIIASGLQMYFSFQTQRKDIINQQLHIAQDAANTVKNFIQEKFSILEAAASLGNLVAVSEEEQKPVLERLLGVEPAFRQLVLLNAQEEELLRVSRLSKLLSVQLMEYNKSELFSKVRQKETHISSIYIDKITSEPMVIMAVPVTDVFGDFKGVLTAEVNLKFMWDLVDSIKIGNKGRAYVVDRQGNLIAFGDISRILKGENLLRLKEVAKFVNAEELLGERKASISKGIQGTYVVASHVPLGRPSWAVVVELPLHEAYGSVIQGFGLAVAIILISIILAIVAGTYLSRRITKPIIDLRDAALEVGKGRLDTQIEIKTKDEIEDLAKAFNQMTQDLQMTTTSIDNLNQEITERKRVEEALRRAEEKYRIQFEGALDAIFVADAKTGIIIDCNPAATRLIGREKPELVGKHQRILHPPEETEGGFSRTFKQHLEEKQGQTLETQVVTKEGEIKDVAIKATLLDIRGKKVIQGIFRDITESKKAEEKIKSSLKEKEVMLKEIHHRVKNNLQIISSLLNLQSRHIKDNKEVLEMFKECQNRVKSMALIHNKLYQSRDMSRIDFAEYVHTLTQDLFQSYKISPGNIELKVNAESVFMDINSAIPCGLIINELVSNSLKHAFPDGKRGEITIDLHKDKDNKLSLSVADNGAGFPEGLDFKQTESLGLRLVCILTEQLGGRMSLNRKKGTKFSLKI